MNAGKFNPTLNELRAKRDRLLEVLLGSVAIVDEELERAAEVESLGLTLRPSDALLERLLGEREGVLVVAGFEGFEREEKRLVGLGSGLGERRGGIC